MKFGKERSKLIEQQSIRKSTKLQPLSESRISSKYEPSKNHHSERIIDYQDNEIIESRLHQKKQAQKRKEPNKKEISHKEDGKTTSQFIKNKAKSPPIPHSPSGFTKSSKINSPKNVLHLKISSLKTHEDEEAGISVWKLNKQEINQSTNVTNLDVDTLLLNQKLSKSKLQQLNSQLISLQTKLKEQEQKIFQLSQENMNLQKKIGKMQQLSQQNKKMLRQRIQSFNKEGQNMRKMKNQIVELQKIVIKLKEENEQLRNELQKIKNLKENMKIQQNHIKIIGEQTPNMSEKSYLTYGQLPLYTIIKGQANENQILGDSPVQQYFLAQSNQAKQVIKIVNNTNTNDSILSALIKDINQNNNFDYLDAQVQTDEMLQNYNYKDQSNFPQDSLQKAKQSKQIQEHEKLLQIDRNKYRQLKQSYQKSLKQVQERFQFVIVKNYQKISEQEEQIFNLWQKLYQVSDVKNSKILMSKSGESQKNEQKQKPQKLSVNYGDPQIFRYLTGKLLNPLEYRQKIQKLHTYILELKQKFQILQQKWSILITENQINFVQDIASLEEQEQNENFQSIQIKSFKIQIKFKNQQKFQKLKQIFKQNSPNLQESQLLQEDQIDNQQSEGASTSKDSSIII